MSRVFGIFFFVKLHKILREKCCNVGYYAQNRAAAAAFRAATRKQAGEGLPPAVLVHAQIIICREFLHIIT